MSNFMNYSGLIKMKKINKKNIKNIMILGSIGIGNLLLFSPALKLIRREFPDAKLTLIILKKAFKYLYGNSEEIDEIMVVEEKKYPCLKDKIKLILELRRKKFNLSITTFPSNRFEYNLLPFLAGVKYRIANRYPLKYWRSLSFLQNLKVSVDMNIHDLEQNLNLLKPLNINSDIEKKIYLEISNKNSKKAAELLKNMEINEKNILLGFHPGSSLERGMILKRWKDGKFAELGKKLIEKFEVKILIFGGKEEDKLKEDIKKLIGKGSYTVSDISLLDTAALIEKCKIFVSNDSGLMHIAVAMNVKTVALFGPSDPQRTSPYGEKHIVIKKKLDCNPCWSIKNLGVGRIKCEYNYCKPMEQIEVEEVFDAISEIFLNNRQKFTAETRRHREKR